MGAPDRLAPSLLEDWRRYEKRLLDRLKARDRELQELHEDFMAQQAELRRYQEFYEVTTLLQRWKKRASNG